MIAHYGIIYKIVNNINGKIYIGQTTRPILARVKAHFKEAQDGKLNNYFKNAIKKYGSKSFTWFELEKAYSEKELDCLEKFYIKKYNSFNNINGYNSTSGGGSGKKCSESVKQKLSTIGKGHIVTPETRLKISTKQKGKKYADEYKLKLSIGHKNQKGLKGFKHSDQSRKNMSVAHKGQKSYMKGKYHSKEAKEKNRLAHLGKPSKLKGIKLNLTEEQRKYRSEIQKGRPAWNKGICGVIKKSEESKKKLSIKMKGHITKESTKLKISLANKGKIRNASTIEKMKLAWIIRKQRQNGK